MKSSNDGDDQEDVSIKVNSNFVTNVAIRSSPNMPDLSPYMKRKLQIEIEEKRFCDHRQRHDLAAFLSPRRSRTLVRSCPYNYSPILLRPAMPPISSVLLTSSSRQRTVGRLRRGPVRFNEDDVAGVHTFRSSKPNIYPLDEDITARFSSIQLVNSEKQDSDSQTVTDKIPDLSSLSLTRNS